MVRTAVVTLSAAGFQANANEGLIWKHLHTVAPDQYTCVLTQLVPCQVGLLKLTRIKGNVFSADQSEYKEPIKKT